MAKLVASMMMSSAKGGFLTIPPITNPTLPFTPTTFKKKSAGAGFMVTVICVMVFIYVGYITTVLASLLYPGITISGIILGVLFNFIFFMVVAAYTKCVTTDPGEIPRHWAFYRGDVAKRRRYCKECNAWKPDRTHHCSACSSVLNMDHHCPWVNNCVGFYNRKFFMQLLVYGVLGLSLTFVHGVYCVSTQLWGHFITYPSIQNITDIVMLTITIAVTSIAGFLCLAMAQFLAFHIRLVASNLTTIENLDYAARESGKYDLGASRNCQQVFGPYILLWWIPHHTALSSPVGDGVRWTTHSNADNS